jgi:RHS repeat-associated protein
MSKSIYTRAVSTITLVSFWSSLLAPHAAQAQEEPIEVELTDGAEQAADSREAWSEGDEAEPDDAAKEPSSEAHADESRPLAERALPVGEAKSAVTPTAISLPQAEGAIKGMGESFQPELSAGTASFSIPIALPPGRAGVEPALALSYQTTAGNGAAGLGWDVSYPRIARQTDKGLPRYRSSSNGLWHEQEDVFIFNDGEELVPVVSSEATAIDGASVPSELAGYQQYRTRVENAFMRFFRAPDGLSWVVQDKSGQRFDFGVLDDGEGPSDATEASVAALLSEYEDGGGRVFSWALTRVSDPHGSTIYYRYFRNGGQRYLSDVHYVSPATCVAPSAAAQRDCAAPLAEYGRRVRLAYEERDDAFDSYLPTWRVRSGLRLSRIEITAAESSSAARTMVRRYHLRYEPTSFLSLLSELQVEGRPDEISVATGVAVADRFVPEESLTPEIIGRTLPPMRFGYTAPDATSPSVEGFPGIDGRVKGSGSSPPHSIDDARADFFDVNSDGLPDVIVTDPATYQTDSGAPAIGVFFNGFRGTQGRAAIGGEFSEAVPVAIAAGYGNVLQLANANVTPMDIDGDGRSDLLHMPRVASYGYFTPVRERDVANMQMLPARQSWSFARVAVDLPAGQIDPRIDFGRDASFIKTFDVDNDRLIDVVRTTGSVMQTWLNLGRYPGGEGLFGSASFVAGSWSLSTEPLESCLLQEGRPVDFANGEIQIADMNGDGILDVVEARHGYVAYWPGRGPGLWGDGAASCVAGDGEGRAVVMDSAPTDVNPELDGVFLSDVNHDGAADIVQVRFDAIDVWFNRAGHGFTARTTAHDTPPAPAFASSVRLLDIDGSATLDIVYAQGSDYKWIDPMGGTRPRLLQVIENGLGGLTELEHGSSAQDYLRDLADAAQCTDSGCQRYTWNAMSGSCDDKVHAVGGGCFYRSAGSPVISTVIRSSTTRDQLSRLGREENVRRNVYAYHDGYYEGIEQEFRGFGTADVVSVGDAGQPTSVVRTSFHQGRRAAEIASDRLADNPDEALKGRPYLVERHDASGVYVSTHHTTMVTRELLQGLNGVAVVHAFPKRIDELLYDTAPFVPSFGALLADPLNAGRLELASVLRERAGSGINASLPLPDATLYRALPLRSSAYAHMVTTIDQVDNAGNDLLRTAHGRLRGEHGEPIPNEAIQTHSVPVRVDPSSSGAWLWREAASHVRGHGDEGQSLARVTQAFTAAGDSRSQTRPVALGSSAPAYVFGGDGAGAASYPSTPIAMVTSTAFDSWGNPTMHCAGGDLGEAGTDTSNCLQLRAVTYDERFQQLPELESIAADGPIDGLRWLSTEALWDFGLNVPLSVFDPNRLETRLEHDGLGRLTSLTPPAVYECDGSDVPLTRVEYDVATPARPVTIVRMYAEEACAALGQDTARHLVYLDGFGRKRVELRDAEDPDDPAFASRTARSSLVTLHAKGNIRERYQPDLIDLSLDDVTPSQALSLPSGVPSTYEGFDAFDRLSMALAEDAAMTRVHYHALSQELWDPLDLDHSSPHYRTPTTERVDGHRRVIDTVLRNSKGWGTGVELYRLYRDYRADDRVVALTRAQTSTDAPRTSSPVLPGRSMTRTFVFDTQGRRIGSVDPDTDNTALPAGQRGWRYLFNRVGQLAAVRDPRGCGQNFFYDRAGRVIGEDYVRCAEAQVGGETTVATVPAGTIALDDDVPAGTPVDARFYFDEYPDWFDNSEGFDVVPTGANRILGRATATVDRAQRSAMAYDGRGNVIWEARQMAVVPNADSLALTIGNPPQLDTSDSVSARAVVFDGETYVLERSFDHASRARSIRLPVDSGYSAGSAPRIGGVLDYNVRGLVARSAITIDQTARSIIDRVDYTRDGLPEELTYGDAFGGDREPTVSRLHYDIKRRPSRVSTVREPTAEPGESPISGRALGGIATVADQQLIWDVGDNLIAVHDYRDPTEWRNGFRPVSYAISHDALYRIAGIDYDYTQDSGARVPSDAFVDYRAQLGQVEDQDPMRTEPAPLLPTAPSNRVASLTYEYDWLANMVDWTDDAGQFYERSLGRIDNGSEESGGRPSALRVASDLPTTSPASYQSGVDRGGYVEVDLGVSGNIVVVTAHAQCHDHDGVRCYDNEALANGPRRTHLRNNCECESEQNYQYRYDELNQLVDARRYDREGGSGSWGLAARQRYRYDGAGNRAVKQTMDESFDVFGEVEPDGSSERIALTIYEGAFERRGLVRDLAATDYQTSGLWASETQYLVSGARAVIKRGGSAIVGELDRDLRITVPISDALQSTSSVIDLMSGALVETSTYYPNGARETYRAPDGPGDRIAAEPRGFTSKEADEEVGAIYFGARYLLPHLGRWATPDPLSVHSAGGSEVGNSYHYVSGNLLQARDPLGLDEAMIVPTQKLTEGKGRTLLRDARRFGGQWQKKPETQRHLVDATGPATNRHGGGSSSKADREATVRAWRNAAEASRDTQRQPAASSSSQPANASSRPANEPNVVVANFGHGTTNAVQLGPNGSLTMDETMVRGYRQALADPKGRYTAEQRAFHEIGEALRANGVQRVDLAVCNVGTQEGRAFLQQLADAWGVEVRAPNGYFVTSDYGRNNVQAAIVEVKPKEGVPGPTQDLPATGWATAKPKAASPWFPQYQQNQTPATRPAAPPPSQANQPSR